MSTYQGTGGGSASRGALRASSRLLELASDLLSQLLAIALNVLLLEQQLLGGEKEEEDGGEEEEEDGDSSPPPDDDSD